jgi:hypothetical protein
MKNRNLLLIFLEARKSKIEAPGSGEGCSLLARWHLDS